MSNWLNTDPGTWSYIAAGYEQDCPDDCGQRIATGTAVTKVSGVWRRFDCALTEWARHKNVITGTEAEYVAATKRVTSLGGYVVGRSWAADRPRDARFHWTEVLPK